MWHFSMSQLLSNRIFTTQCSLPYSRKTAETGFWQKRMQNAFTMLWGINKNKDKHKTACSRRELVKPSWSAASLRLCTDSLIPDTCTHGRCFASVLWQLRCLGPCRGSEAKARRETPGPGPRSSRPGPGAVACPALSPLPGWALQGWLCGLTATSTRGLRRHAPGPRALPRCCTDWSTHMCCFPAYSV